MKIITLADMPSFAGANVEWDAATNKFNGTVVDTDTFLSNGDVMGIITPAIESAIAALPEDAMRSDADITALAETAIEAALGNLESVENLAGEIQGYLVKKP